LPHWTPSLEAAGNVLVGDVFILVFFGPPLFVLAAIVWRITGS
jgi:hypothetical protein